MQLNKAERWKLWHVPLKQAFAAKPSGYVVTNNYPQQQFKIKTAHLTYNVLNRDAANFKISVLQNYITSQCSVYLSVLPGTNFTKVVSETKAPLIKTLFAPGNKDDIGKMISKDLKEFIETPELYYGFSIQVRGVVDSNIAVLKKTVAVDEKFTTLAGMLNKLNQYANTNKLTVLQPPMLQFQPLSNDSLTIVMMLAVNKQGPSENNINCSKMPVNGRMLVGRFRGKFADRTQLNAAMEKYIFDKNLESIVNSYEKYYSNPLPQNELSTVDMEIYYPII